MFLESEVGRLLSDSDSVSEGQGILGHNKPFILSLTLSGILIPESPFPEWINAFLTTLETWGRA